VATFAKADRVLAGLEIPGQVLVGLVDFPEQCGAPGLTDDTVGRDQIRVGFPGPLAKGGLYPRRLEVFKKLTGNSKAGAEENGAGTKQFLLGNY